MGQSKELRRQNPHTGDRRLAQLNQIALEGYDRIVCLCLEYIAVDGRITKVPKGGELAGRSRWVGGKRGMAFVRAGRRWKFERTNAFGMLARCYERRTMIIDTFVDLADTIITIRSLMRQARTTHRWA